MCELMRPNSAGYGGEYGDVWVDIRHQFVGMASAGHTGESDSWLSCHPSNGWLWWWRLRWRWRWTCPGSIKEQGLGPRTQSRVMCGSAGCYRPSGKSSKARSVSDVAEWQQPAVPIFVPLLFLLLLLLLLAVKWPERHLNTRQPAKSQEELSGLIPLLT